MAPGTEVRLERISEEVELDMASLAYLDANRFIPGACALVASRGPDETLLLELGEATVAFGPELSSRPVRLGPLSARWARGGGGR